MARLIKITPAGIARSLLCIIVIFLFLDLVVIYFHFVRGHRYLRGFIHGFYFDNEANFPSLYSALAILLCSVLLWRIGSTAIEKKRRRWLHWKFLAIVFAFLALDEFVGIHEYLFYPARESVKNLSLDSGYFHFAWFVPYGIAVMVIAVILLKFFLSLPLRLKILFTLSGLTFLAGAVGMEMIGGKYWADQGWAIDHSDPVDFNYALIVTFEELLEMLGIALFIYPLSEYYLSLTGVHSLTVRFSDADQPD